MRCWKCGAHDVSSICLLCGCQQDTRQKTTTEVGQALRYAYDKFGSEQILTDHETLRRCLSDLIPSEKKLREQITSVMRTDTGHRLFDILRNNQEPDENDCWILMRNIQEDCGLTEEQARAVLGYLLEMIGCENRCIAKAPPVGGGAGPGKAPTSGPGSGPSVPPPPTNNDVHILASLPGAVLADATQGLSWGMSPMYIKAKKGTLYVRNDGVAIHYYHGIALRKDRAKQSIDPDIFIPRSDIIKVTENFFMTAHDFTIATVDGKRYRAMASASKGAVLKVVEAIRSIIL